MSTTDLYELVFSSDGAQQTIRQTGRLPESWLQKYLSSIQDAHSSFDSVSAWPKRIFQTLHFASMYLPLRYDAWAASAQNSNSTTESSVAEIRFATEEYLWLSLVDIDLVKSDVSFKEHVSFGKSGMRLVQLCFGGNSPLVEPCQPDQFRSWKGSYEACLRDVEVEMKTEQSWPKVICMAIHFASFYIDLFQSQRISLDQLANEELDVTHSNRVDNVIWNLRPVIGNEAVLRLIHLWLTSSFLKRDQSGLPRIGERRPRTGQFISVRTLSEAFLLDGVNVIAS